MRLRLVLASLGAVTALLVPAAASAAVSPNADPTVDPSIATYSHMQLAYDSAFCLSFSSGHTANGTPLQMFNCNSTAEQQWILIHVADEDHVDGWVMQNKATDKCIQASSTNLRSALVEEPCILSVTTNPNFKLQLFGKGNGPGICPAINGTKTFIPANLNHYPDGDIYPSGGNPGAGVHLYFNHPSGSQPESLVCWTLPNEVTPTA